MRDIIIIGGGVAGLSAALRLNQLGWLVTVIEKRSFPQHKVCGEYVSNEVLDYLIELGADVKEVKANPIEKFVLTSVSGRKQSVNLGLGGFGLSRYTFDQFLFQKGKQAGVEFLTQTEVLKVEYNQGVFEVNCNKNLSLKAKVVIGSFGKRSKLDKQLNRRFFSKRGNYAGVKYFFDYSYPKGEVSLHNFQGGYCGALRVEDGSTSVAYLADQNLVKKSGSLENFEQKYLLKNPVLKEIFSTRNLLDKRLSISNISFDEKELVQDHILMIGDAAGMIAPVCGNGMAMGIHAGKIASKYVDHFLMEKISRSDMEKSFEKEWKQNFSKRVFWGRHLQGFMGSNFSSEFALIALNIFPFILPRLIKLTHGNPISKDSP